MDQIGLYSTRPGTIPRRWLQRYSFCNEWKVQWLRGVTVPGGCCPGKAGGTLGAGEGGGDSICEEQTLVGSRYLGQRDAKGGYMERMASASTSILPRENRGHEACLFARHDGARGACFSGFVPAL